MEVYGYSPTEWIIGSAILFVIATLLWKLLAGLDAAMRSPDDNNSWIDDHGPYFVIPIWLGLLAASLVLAAR